MKIDLKNISKIKISGYGKVLRPARDWLILFSITCVLLAAGAVWHTWLFSKVIKGEPLEEASAQDTVQAPELDTVRSLFERRKTEEVNYFGEYRFVDPSAGGR